MWIALIIAAILWLIAAVFGPGAREPEPGGEPGLRARELLDAAERRRPLSMWDVVQLSGAIAREAEPRFPGAARDLRGIGVDAVNWAMDDARRTGRPAEPFFAGPARSFCMAAREQARGPTRADIDKLRDLLRDELARGWPS